MNRYSRQNLTYGNSATEKLFYSRVVLIGLDGGLATEIAKNLILSGLNNLWLFDIKPGDDSYKFKPRSGLDSMIHGNTLQDDMVGFYYLDEESIKYPQLDTTGKSTRTEILIRELSKLNPNSNILEFNEIETFNDKDLVIMCSNQKIDGFSKLIDNINNANCKLVWASCKGVMGFVFSDSLKNHEIIDMDGENYEPIQIESISQSGMVDTIENIGNLQDNDLILIDNVILESGIEIKTQYPNVSLKFRIKIIGKNKIKLIMIEDENLNCQEILNLLSELTNGTLQKVKEKKLINNISILESMKEENENSKNFDKVLANLFWDFADTEFPATIEDLKNWLDTKGKRLNSNYPVSYLRKIIKSLYYQIPCFESIIGAFASNEVIKLLTNKFEPIDQWLFFSEPDLIPDEDDILKETGEIITPLFGNKCKDFIEKSKWLLVGCGAIGCEMLKNLSLLGFKNLIITDPDHIEISNLSRQFLFTNNDIGKSKSEVAARQVLKYASKKGLSSKLSVTDYKEKLGYENQKFVNELFEDHKIDGVINALDNIEARKYMDEQCFRFQKPLFESGTQGVKGNTQPVIPFLTETYSNSSDPPQENSYPVCTIKNFPNQIHHTIHWAMDHFEFFKRAPENYNKYISNPNYLDELEGFNKNQAIKDIKIINENYSDSWESCAKFAYKMYQENYRDQILQILHNFPPDNLNNDGTLFWSKGKRCPSLLNFDNNGDVIYEYIFELSKLLCYIYNISDEYSILDVKNIEFKEYQFQPSDGVKISKNDEEEKDSSKVNHKDVENLQIFEPKCTNVRPIIFEKDDDSNHHINFIKCSSNLRALNYGIKPIGFDETKSIAGKIIPAVATTTSLVSGLITVEILKYCIQKANNNWDLNIYKSSFNNLATNLHIFSTPIDAPILKIGEKELNSWEKFEDKADIKVSDFLEKYSKVFETKIIMLLHNSSILYAEFMNTNCNLDDSISVLLNKNLETVNYPVDLIIGSEDDIELPTIKLIKSDF